MIESEKRTKGWPIKWKRKSPRKKSQKLASLAFEIFSEGFSFSTLLVISPSLFPGLTFSLFHGSSFPSFFFIPLFPLFYDPSFPSLLFMPFFPLFHGSSFPSSMFISSFPLFLGSSFPSLFITSFLYDLQPLPSRPCPRHMIWNDSWKVLPSTPLSLQSKPSFEIYFQIFLKLLWTDLPLVLNQCDVLMEWSCSYYTQLIFVPFWDVGVFLFEWLGDRFEIVLVSIWDRFGIFFEIVFDHFGMTLGSFWNHFVDHQRWPWGVDSPCPWCCLWNPWGGG